MMLRTNKAIAVVLAFVFCMSFLAPGLIAPQAAEAAVSYEVLKAPSVNTDTVDATLGTVKVSLPDVRVLDATYAEYLTITLPSGVEFDANSDVELDLTGTDIVKAASAKDGSSTWNIELKSDGTIDNDNDQSFLMTFKNIYVKNGSGDVEISITSSGSVFPSAKLVIAKIGDGSTTTRIGSVETISDEGTIDDIVIEESMAGVLKDGNVIELRLPSGFAWDYSDAAFDIVGGWGLSSNTDKTYFDISTKSDDKILVIELGTDTKTFVTSSNTAGKLTIKNLVVEVNDDSKTGEIEVNVSGSSDSDVTDEDIVVAKCGDFGVAVSEKETKEVVSGKDEQEIGSFYIEEDLAGSLVKSRSIVLELPSGVKWQKLPQIKVEDGSSNVLAKSPFSIVSNSSDRKIKATIDNASTEAAKLLVEKGEVYVEPGFEGDIEIEVSGSADVEGTVKVAEAVKAVEFTVENVPDVIIGQQSQKVADMLIKEGQKGAIQENKDIVIELDTGFKFAKEPKVEVTEGNLEIDDVDINSDDQLVIKIDSESTKASTIQISDVYVTGLRYAPEGKVVATLVEAEGNGTTNSGSTALDSLFNNEYSEKSAGEVVIANCVTPAEQEGSSASFRIDSNVYTLNGATKVMDVAPYVKDSRTFMPIRYVAYALGLSDDDIVWDDATQKVTLTKGDTVVELVIGSSSIIVNGEAQAMDVAPEITNSRTMLPARFVAEAFGANVGWDPATRTVVID